MTARRAVVFDIGQVLVQFDPALAVRGLARETDATAERVEAALFEGDHYGAYSRGRLDGAAFHLRFASELARSCATGGAPPPRPLSFADFDRAWCEMFWPMPGMDELVAQVAALCPVLLCSNTDPLHYAHLRRTVPSLGFAQAAVLSFEVGAEKPEPAIYAALASEIPVPTASAIFVDDRADNVLGALNAGFDALQFMGIATLREALSCRGLAVGPGDGLSS